MTIVCGTDLSAPAREAALAAGHLSAARREPLQLVHVLELMSSDVQSPDPLTRLSEARERELESLAADVRRETGAEVGFEIERGFSDGVLVTRASELSASLIVVGARGARGEMRWLLGSTAERVARDAPMPVLVVRDAAAIESWAKTRRPLRVVVGVEPAPTSQAALLWAASLAQATGAPPVRLTAVQVVWPPGEKERLGLPSRLPLDELAPESRRVLEADFARWREAMPGLPGDLEYVAVPGWGRVDAQIAQLAAERQADLLVVGNHRRSRSARLWQGSISQGVVHRATVNVVVVPRTAVPQAQLAVPRCKAVVVATDFSVLGNRAVGVGLSLLPEGGHLHLVHVNVGVRAEEANLREALSRLVPREAAERRIVATFEVISSEQITESVLQAAARSGADLICMGTHGRSALGAATLGSAAAALVHRSGVPVLLVPPERS